MQDFKTMLFNWTIDSFKLYYTVKKIDYSRNSKFKNF